MGKYLFRCEMTDVTQDFYGDSQCCSLSHLTYEQFTGLLDSQGKEIYEGDIVVSQKQMRDVRFGEFWDGEDTYNGFFLQDPNINHRNFGSSKIDRFICSKVVGNIHENPELLST
jgi:uncharacterized phage protein (TIGR01671 family)